MGKIGKVAAAAGITAVSTLGLVQPAAAHADPGAAIVAGIIGLGVGAAIASDHHHHYRRHYYAGPPRYYGPPPGAYYAPPPPPPAYYYGYGYPSCEWRGCW